VTISAREAELRGNPEDNTLSVLLTDGVVEVGSRLTLAFTDTVERKIPLSDATRKGFAETSPSYCPLTCIPAETRRQRTTIRQIQQQLAAETAYRLVSGDLSALNSPEHDVRFQELEHARYRLCRLKTEPWRRWANGFSCFFFVVAGIPLAIRQRNGDFLTSFFLCFLPILLIYYPLLAFGVDRAKCGALPPCTVWLGNIVLLLAGWWMMRRVLRY
jgi:lipopolysaccharide export system permease protein